MKDRIRKVMESQNMTQQEFADFVHISPASLSSVFTGRTRPTLAIVEAIKGALPDISTDWLMFGNGNMWLSENTYYNNVSAGSEQGETEGGSAAPNPPHPDVVGGASAVLDFGGALPAGSSSSSNGSYVPQSGVTDIRFMNNVVKNNDIKQRTITEIRIFFSDQTWETFVPKK